MTPVEAIKERAAVADVLALFGVPVRRKTFRCPLHDDHSPSAHDYGARWWCFTCNAGGDLIDLTAAILKSDNVGAIRFLCDRFRIHPQGARPYRLQLRPAPDYTRVLEQAITAVHVAIPRYKAGNHSLNSVLDYVWDEYDLMRELWRVNEKSGLTRLHELRDWEVWALKIIRMRTEPLPDESWLKDDAFSDLGYRKVEG